MYVIRQCLVAVDAEVLEEDLLQMPQHETSVSKIEHVSGACILCSERIWRNPRICLPPQCMETRWILRFLIEIWYGIFTVSVIAGGVEEGQISVHLLAEFTEIIKQCISWCGTTYTYEHDTDFKYRLHGTDDKCLHDLLYHQNTIREP
jgi:hypothetical protein